MKQVLIASFDMEVGGVERSLVSLLNNFDHENYEVDLMLYKHTGEFMSLLPVDKIHLIEEIKAYSIFRESLAEVIRNKKYTAALMRVLAIVNAKGISKLKKLGEACYCQMQLVWQYTVPFLPSLTKEYDVAISYLWPHYFVKSKVKAKKKIAWIHTDYSKLETEIKTDLKMWEGFDHIIAVSQECKKSFLLKYPSLCEKVKVIENITSPEFIHHMSNQETSLSTFAPEYFNLLSVARFSYAKGIDQAIYALKALHNRGLTQIKWYVIGYGGDEEMLKQLIKAEGLEEYFILLGKQTNPYPYMKACDLYVQPSRYEGKAVTVSEAQILGRPVLITNYPTAKSQVKDGVNGYICELSIEGIAEGIEKLYRDNRFRNQLANNCMMTDFSNSKELQKLYELMGLEGEGSCDADQSECYCSSIQL